MANATDDLLKAGDLVRARRPINTLHGLIPEGTQFTVAHPEAGSHLILVQVPDLPEGEETQAWNKPPLYLLRLAFEKVPPDDEPEAPAPAPRPKPKSRDA